MIIQRKTHDRRRCECRNYCLQHLYSFWQSIHLQASGLLSFENFLQLNKFITIKNKGFHFRAYMYVYKEKKPLGMKIKWLSVEFFNFRGYVILIHFYYLSLILTRLLSYIRHAFTLLCKPFRLGLGNWMFYTTTVSARWFCRRLPSMTVRSLQAYPFHVITQTLTTPSPSNNDCLLV